jgi:hypothetical protein
MRKRKGPNTWIIIIGIFLALLLLRKMDFLPSWGNIFSAKLVTIDETPILIKEIKSLGQVITATLYDEVVVDSTIVHRFPHLPLTNDHLVIIARGKVLAGIDLKLLADNDVRVLKDTVWMKMPATKIIDVIINPGDYETFEEKGNWSTEGVIAVKSKAKNKIIERSSNNNILEKATLKAKTVLHDFLLSSGFKVIYLN